MEVLVHIRVHFTVSRRQSKQDPDQSKISELVKKSLLGFFKVGNTFRPYFLHVFNSKRRDFEKVPKKIEPIDFKNESILPKKCYPGLRNMGYRTGIDLEKLIRNPDPGVKKALAPGSGFAKIRNTVKKEMSW